MAVVMAVGSPGQRTQHRSHEGRGGARGRGVWGKLPGSRGSSRGATRDARRSHQRLRETRVTVTSYSAKSAPLATEHQHSAHSCVLDES